MSGGSKPTKAPATEQEKALAQVGGEQFNDYLDNGIPRVKQTREAIRATDAKLSDAARVATAGVEAAGAQQRAGFAVPTGGSRDAFKRNDYDQVMAGARAAAATGAREGVTDLETKGEQKLAAFGRKLSNDTQLSLAESGRRATDAAVADATRKFEWNQTKQSAVAGQDARIASLAAALRGGK